MRLDSLLAERGLFESRTRAAAAVLAGQVHLGPGRRRAEKPGQLVDAAIELDVAYGEIDWRLREDPRVTVVERTNARTLEPGMLEYRPELLTIDVSFISLTKVLPAVLVAAASEYDCLAMVKPQFEVGREALGKGGVVRDPELRRAAVHAIAACARELGAAVMGSAPSALAGPSGNRETFLWLAEDSRGGAPGEVEAW
jgi:23S rRNA (cytidine1920-2'-O)/16S rRNA (cytidine1409-2'-O)-methyltransferase